MLRCPHFVCFSYLPTYPPWGQIIDFHTNPITIFTLVYITCNTPVNHTDVTQNNSGTSHIETKNTEYLTIKIKVRAGGGGGGAVGNPNQCNSPQKKKKVALYWRRTTF
jgi:hypothetical protein